ncbi:unnamed protein product [Mytilus coruscus]|uniref:MULE transposase domain-containing protein n=1 Tax=Mytilus coruscus TaxID=42192 RepID=A0A6J8ELX1_MYTCO|nr:unnamed protein product [Mytilus coruscus]
MDILHTETSRGVKSLIIDGHTYRKVSVLKHNNISYRCTIKSCKASVTTDSDGLTIVKTQNEHNHVADDRKTEAKELRVRSREKSGDVFSRPSKIVRTDLQGTKESHLVPKYLKNASLAVYRERRKDTPVLPKSRDDVHTATSFMLIETNKSEKFLLTNDREKGVLIFSTHLNLECLCNDMSAIFIDGTFKCCPKYFYQLYTLHGCKNGNYVPLIYALLPAKDEQCYEVMWKIICDLCRQQQRSFVPEVIHIDFEQAMHNEIMDAFPQCRIDCCRFHLDQNW